GLAFEVQGDCLGVPASPVVVDCLGCPGVRRRQIQFAGVVDVDAYGECLVSWSEAFGGHHYCLVESDGAHGVAVVGALECDGRAKVRCLCRCARDGGDCVISTACGDDHRGRDECALQAVSDRDVPCLVAGTEKRPAG